MKQAIVFDDNVTLQAVLRLLHATYDIVCVTLLREDAMVRLFAEASDNKSGRTMRFITYTLCYLSAEVGSK